MSWRWIDDEGDRFVGELGVAAQAGGDLPHPGPVQEVERGVAQEREGGRAVVAVDQAGVLAEVDVRVAVDPVLDGPVPAAQGQQAGGRLAIP